MSRYRSTTFQITAIALLAAIAFWGCKKKVEFPEETRDVLGTKVTIVVYDRGMTRQHLRATFDDLFDMMTDWEKKVLQPGPDNQIARIAESAGEKSIPIDDPVFDMLMEAIRLYDASGKTFDVRYGPMLDAWGFDSQPHVPSPAELDSLKTFVEQGGMFVAGKSILLAKKGMRFDVREIAIGHIFDMAAAKLAEAGIRTAMISCPRVCRTMGDPPNRRGFEMPLANPLNPSEPWGTLRVPVGGTACANASVDRFSAAGKSYHSLLDPRTGFPAETCAGAIVQAPRASTAQALAYALFVSGTPDSLAKEGKAAVGGSMVIREEGGNLISSDAGSLKDGFERAR